MPIVVESWSLNLLEPSGPVQACNGIALPLLCLMGPRVEIILGVLADRTHVGVGCVEYCWRRGHNFEVIIQLRPTKCSHRCTYNIPYCVYNCLPEDVPKRFETCRRQQKLKINVENSALHCFFCTIVSRCVVKKTSKKDLEVINLTYAPCIILQYVRRASRK